MTAAEIPASNNLTTRAVHTPVNTDEHKAFKTLFNKSASNLEYSVLKNINKKQQMLTRSIAILAYTQGKVFKNLLVTV